MLKPRQLFLSCFFRTRDDADFESAPDQEITGFAEKSDAVSDVCSVSSQECAGSTLGRSSRTGMNCLPVAGWQIAGERDRLTNRSQGFAKVGRS